MPRRDETKKTPSACGGIKDLTNPAIHTKKGFTNYENLNMNNFAGGDRV
jgi:hypothetical protein